MKKITRQRQQQKTMQKIYQSSRFYDKNALRKLKKPRFRLDAQAYVGVYKQYLVQI